jgi:hypothetical protein
MVYGSSGRVDYIHLKEKDYYIEIVFNNINYTAKKMFMEDEVVQLIGPLDDTNNLLAKMNEKQLLNQKNKIKYIRIQKKLLY